ncbi:PREDICTED: homeobox protein MSX-1-like [Acropora digitifera]|uniref:homeobox protein MSX-1-like n=1 Tax=Acropora digitifera TaxID=70779 RepID=UPI00077A8B7E|nr:PREDICTED: homeobox protein MSX-1-like [Acropora digitifera]
MKVELKSSFQECFSKQDETPFSLVLAAEASSLHSLWPAARDYSKLIMAGDRVTDPVDNKASQPSLVSKPYLSFSIENILRSPGTFGAQKPRRSETPEKRQIGNNDTTGMIHEETLQTRLPWLAYTRYCPPKLPRSKPRKGCRRHKLDRSPRIPFSSSQLASLEAKFLQTQYLSGSEVHDLSSWLSVSEHRVKIWFQNRRAREKKTKAVSVVTSK